MKSDLERAREAFSDIAESAHRDVAIPQTDFLGRMGAALGAYESIFDEYPDGELPDDVREDAEGQMLELSGLAMAQLVMLRHPNDPLAAFAKSECATRDAEIERLTTELRRCEEWFARVRPATDEANDYLNEDGWDDMASIHDAARAALSNKDAG